MPKFLLRSSEVFYLLFYNYLKDNLGQLPLSSQRFSVITVKKNKLLSWGLKITWWEALKKLTNNSENLEYRKCTHNFTHSLCKCKYYEISDYTDLKFGDREKEWLICSQHSTMGGDFLKKGLQCSGLDVSHPSQPQPTHCRALLAVEMRLRKGKETPQRSKAEEEGKTCKKWPCRQQGQTRREMGCPKCQSRDAPAETRAEQRGFPAGIAAQGKPTLEQD